MSSRSHVPSLYRSLVREAKQAKFKDSKEFRRFFREARKLDDPYYSALALFRLSSDSRVPLTEAYFTAGEALDIVKKVKRIWRRGELISAIARFMGKWRTDGSDREDTERRELLFERIMDLLSSLPPGKGLSTTIKESAKHLPPVFIEPLLGVALSNTNFIREDTKVAIRAWARAVDKKTASVEKIISLLSGTDDPVNESRFLGYLQLQIHKNNFLNKFPVFEEAIRAALRVPDGNERIEALRYLVSTAETTEELEQLRTAADDLGKPEYSARLFAALGGKADKIYPDVAKEWFMEGVSQAAKVTDARERAGLRLNLAEGLKRSAMNDDAREVFQLALADCDLIPRDGGGKQVLGRIERSATDYGMKIPEKKPDDEITTSCKEDRPIPKEGMHVLALYNTYQGGLSPVHLRAVARAAPLCYAYDLDLALLNFPAGDLDGLISGVTRETNIGKSGRYLRELAAVGRIMLKGPGDIDLHGPGSLGLMVATTANPDDTKQKGLEKLLKEAEKGKGGQRLCLIMGLGKKGLPLSLLKEAKYHLELTGNNVSLETCTVMGIIAERLRTLVSS